MTVFLVHNEKLTLWRKRRRIPASSKALPSCFPLVIGDAGKVTMTFEQHVQNLKFSSKDRQMRRSVSIVILSIHVNACREYIFQEFKTIRRFVVIFRNENVKQVVSRHFVEKFPVQKLRMIAGFCSCVIWMNKNVSELFHQKNSSIHC